MTELLHDNTRMLKNLWISWKDGNCSEVKEIKKLPSWPTWNLEAFPSVRPSRCPTCRLLNLLFEDEDALPLLRRQHSDLFWGQLQDLHNQGGLERGNQKACITFNCHTVGKTCFSAIEMMEWGKFLACLHWCSWVTQKHEKPLLCWNINSYCWSQTIDAAFPYALLSSSPKVSLQWMNKQNKGLAFCSEALQQAADDPENFWLQIKVALMCVVMCMSLPWQQTLNI